MADDHFHNPELEPTPVNLPAVDIDALQAELHEFSAPETLDELIDILIDRLPSPPPPEPDFWEQRGFRPLRLPFDRSTDSTGQVTFGPDFKIRKVGANGIDVTIAQNYKKPTTDTILARVPDSGDGVGPYNVWFEKNSDGSVARIHKAARDYDDLLPQSRRILSTDERSQLFSALYLLGIKDVRLERFLRPNHADFKALEEHQARLDQLHVDFAAEMERINENERQAYIDSIDILIR